MNKEELVEVLRQFDEKRVEELPEKTRNIFYAIMEIADERDELKEKVDNNIIIKDLHDFQNIIISALRYSLGRRTYINSETADFIKKYSEIIDERVKKIMLKDLEEYFECRDIYYKDDECDYNTWKDLYEWLKKIEV